MVTSIGEHTMLTWSRTPFYGGVEYRSNKGIVIGTYPVGCLEFECKSFAATIVGVDGVKEFRTSEEAKAWVESYATERR